MRYLVGVLALFLSLQVEAKMVTVSSVNAFKEAISQGLVVVDFFASWCGPCAKMHPIIEQLSREFPHVTFVKVDIESLAPIASEMHVKSIPTLIFFNNGKVVQRRSGFTKKADVIKLLQALK
jgi:thioredoxin 1